MWEKSLIWTLDPSRKLHEYLQPTLRISRHLKKLVGSGDPKQPCKKQSQPLCSRGSNDSQGSIHSNISSFYGDKSSYKNMGAYHFHKYPVYILQFGKLTLIPKNCGLKKYFLSAILGIYVKFQGRCGYLHVNTFGSCPFPLVHSRFHEGIHS